MLALRTLMQAVPVAPIAPGSTWSRVWEKPPPGSIRRGVLWIKNEQWPWLMIGLTALVVLLLTFALWKRFRSR